MVGGLWRSTDMFDAFYSYMFHRWYPDMIWHVWCTRMLLVVHCNAFVMFEHMLLLSL